MRQGDKLLYDFAEHGKLAIRITAQHDGHELAVIIPMPETAPKWVPQLLAFTVQETIRKLESENTMPEHQSALDADEPGAPPGYLIDPDDTRTGSHQDDDTGCAEQVPHDLWDDDPDDQLARGAGETS